MAGLFCMCKLSGQMRDKEKKKTPFFAKGNFLSYHLRLRAASAFFLRFTLGFS